MLVKILRGIAGVIVGYIFIVAFIMGTFSLLYLAMGADNAYKAGTYVVSMTWIIPTFIIGLIAAFIAGWLCFLIARSRVAVIVFAAIVLFLGIGLAVSQALVDLPLEERKGEVSNFEAMQKSVTPTWVAVVNPVLGAMGILIGGHIKKEEE